MRMPFGKHQGERLEDIPESYLWWILDNVADLNPLLRRAIVRHLEEDEPSPRPAPRPAPTPATRVAEIALARSTLKVLYREASMRFHPDHGGSNEAMVGINFLYERLDEQLSRRLAELGA